MHSTDATKKRASLKQEAMKLEKEVKALAKVGQMGPAARTRQDEADRLKAEADALKDKARLEDLHIWQMKKVKGTETDTKTPILTGWPPGARVTVYETSILAVQK